MDNQVRHLRVFAGGAGTFYREAGPWDAPVLLLPHGYPCSSFQFRNLMPLLADKWRLVAPDYPGFGCSDDAMDFPHTFDGYARWLNTFVEAMKLDRFAIFLHDFGSPIGARLSIMNPARIVGQIIQNGDIPYEDALGPKYADIEKLWSLPDGEMQAELFHAVTEKNFQEEFLNDVRSEMIPLIPPDLWKMHWSLTTEGRREIAAHLLADLKANRRWFPTHREYLVTYRPPTTIIWGPQDHYMPEDSARAYLRDLPNASLYLLDGGHWLLETNLHEVAQIMRRFLEGLEW